MGAVKLAGKWKTARLVLIVDVSGWWVACSAAVWDVSDLLQGNGLREFLGDFCGSLHTFSLAYPAYVLHHKSALLVYSRVLR